MKNLMISIKLLKKNKFINFVIICQIFIMLFFSVKNINEMSEAISEYNYLKNSSLNNGLFYMNKPIYNEREENNSKSNIEDIKRNYSLIKEYIETHTDDFKDFTREKINFYFSNTKKNIMMYDKTTLNILSRHFDNKINLKKFEGLVPALVQNKYSNEYKIGDIIYLDDKKDIKIKIKGYYDKDIKLPSLQMITNKSFPVSELFSRTANGAPIFILEYDENLYKIFETIGESYIENNIIYFKDNLEKEKINAFEKYIKENNLGYYQFTKDLVSEQYKLFLNMMQRYLDIMISFVGILILTIVGMAYINKDLLKNRFKIYIFNGASKKDLYLITFYNYFIILSISILLYIIFYKIVGAYYWTGFSILRGFDAIGNSSIISFNTVTFFIVIIVAILLSMAISLLPVLEIKKQLKNRGKI
ncbi:hypothetical protein ABGF34_05635 [Helcococcus ovis]|uniref:ABC transporter permease n=1 Tax=Helcococcus ovis TaxID=72026 RepID=UPI0038BB260C